jgi:hypothetical protein
MQVHLETPRTMRHPPELDPFLRTSPPSPRYALLINPFHPKDPHASFGKHVLTPTLALTAWRRRPERAAAVLPYLDMSCFYKQSNRLWPFLIRHRLTHALWRPLVEASRRRHLAGRRRLARLNRAGGIAPQAFPPLGMQEERAS